MWPPDAGGQAVCRDAGFHEEDVEVQSQEAEGSRWRWSTQED